MSCYDTIAPDYNTYRSDSIGVATVSACIDSLAPDVAILDMGCGTGKPIAVAIAPKVKEYTGVELSPAMAAQFKKAVPMAKCIVSDLATVDLGESEFGLCFSWGSLCHLRPEAQEAALSIVVRHTKYGGQILFTGGFTAGSCEGSVGPHRVQHYSLGAAVYDELLASLGCEARFKGPVEDGAAYVFAYTCTR